MKKVPFLLVVAIIMTLPLSAFAKQTLPEAVEAYLGTRTCNTYFVEDGASVVLTVSTAGKPSELKWKSSGKTFRGLMNEYLEGFTGKVDVEIQKVKIYPAPKDGKIQPGYELESANTAVAEKDKGGGDLQPVTKRQRPGGEWSFPDSTTQEETKQKFFLSFNWFSTKVSDGASFAWSVVTWVFSALFLLLCGIIFFFRFVAQASAGEKPVKIFGLGIVSINKPMLVIFGWSSFLTFISSLLVVAFFVISVFLWIVNLGWPVWLTAFSFWPVSVWGGKTVNWLTPNLDDNTSALLLGGGGEHHG
ncbi:MAG: hypothetical protein AAB438_01095 [Patescibacteria group bacterium]